MFRKLILVSFLFSVIPFGLSSCSDDETPPPPPPVKAKKVAPKKAEEPALKPISSLAKKKTLEPKEEKPMIKQGTQGSYVLQVGVSQVKAVAKKMQKKLKKEGFSSYLSEVEDPGDLIGTFYRIRLGYFSSVTEARLFGHNNLKPLGYAFWIDSKKNDQVGKPESWQSRSDDEEYEEETEVEETSTSDDSWGNSTEPEKKTEEVKKEEPAPSTPAAEAPTSSDEDWGTPPPVKNEQPAATKAETETKAIVPAKVDSAKVEVTKQKEAVVAPVKTATPDAVQAETVKTEEAKKAVETKVVAPAKAEVKKALPKEDDGWGDSDNDWGTP